eukprot:gene30725-17534_t
MATTAVCSRIATVRTGRAQRQLPAVNDDDAPAPRRKRAAREAAGDDGGG